MLVVYLVYAVAVVGVAFGLWDLATGEISQGIVFLVLSAIWLFFGRADARRRQGRDSK